MNNQDEKYFLLYETAIRTACKLLDDYDRRLFKANGYDDYQPRNWEQILFWPEPKVEKINFESIDFKRKSLEEKSKLINDYIERLKIYDEVCLKGGHDEKV